MIGYAHSNECRRLFNVLALGCYSGGAGGNRTGKIERFGCSELETAAGVGLDRLRAISCVHFDRYTAAPIDKTA